MKVAFVFFTALKDNSSCIIHPKCLTWRWFYLVGKIVRRTEGVHDEGKGSSCVHNQPILILHNLKVAIVSFIHLMQF